MNIAASPELAAAVPRQSRLKLSGFRVDGFRTVKLSACSAFGVCNWFSGSRLCRMPCPL